MLNAEDNSNLERLPNELKFHLFSFFNTNALRQTSITNKVNNIIINDIWIRKIKSEFGIEFTNQHNLMPSQFYQKKHKNLLSDFKRCFNFFNLLILSFNQALRRMFSDYNLDNAILNEDIATTLTQAELTLCHEATILLEKCTRLAEQQKSHTPDDAIMATPPDATVTTPVHNKPEHKLQKIVKLYTKMAEPMLLYADIDKNIALTDIDNEINELIEDMQANVKTIQQLLVPFAKPILNIFNLLCKCSSTLLIYFYHHLTAADKIKIQQHSDNFIFTAACALNPLAMKALMTINPELNSNSIHNYYDAISQKTISTTALGITVFKLQFFLEEATQFNLAEIKATIAASKEIIISLLAKGADPQQMISGLYNNQALSIHHFCQTEFTSYQQAMFYDDLSALLQIITDHNKNIYRPGLRR